MSGPLFDLSGIRFAYADGRTVLDGIDLCIDAGERLALLGANGSGKTTLMQVMVGLLRHHAGRLRAFGRERRNEAAFHEVRARAGFLFQDPNDQLFCPTVAEDVAFGPLNLGRTRADTEAIVDRTLDRLGLAEFRDRVTWKLSGGEKRLVTLATVLAMEPDVLLLDEPTNGLDAEAMERLLGILDGLPQAMLVVSHDTRVIERLATRAVTLEHGRIAKN